MVIDEIKNKYNKLNAELKDTLSHMEKSDRVFIIRNEIKELQNMCSHNNGNYDFSNQDQCPYCGKKFRK